MRDRGLSFAALIGLAVLTAARPGAALACLPPPPDWVPPTDEERVRSAASWASDIVYGEVVRGGTSDSAAHFRVIHVHKGRFRPGMTIRARPGWGLDPPMCPGMAGPPPPVPRGTRGTIVFRSDNGELNFLSERELELMIAGGFIEARPARAVRTRR